MVDQPVSVASTLSWNTFLSRTSISSLSAAVFPSQGQAAHGLSDVIRAVRSLNLPRHRYEDFSREEILGEGETFLVERCVSRVENVVAIKHLKLSGGADDHMFHRRLRSVILELQIMRHPPLKAHPNITPGYGYGWNKTSDIIMPFIVVEYARLGTMREHLERAHASLSDIEVLLGDISSGLAALHTCRIIHGDVKLDNVLIFPSMSRPAKALAKITDFGHALILSDESKGEEPLMYAGTLMYNAPEVKEQGSFPIQRTDLRKCDIWAFGLLIWEACIKGEEYPTYLRKREFISESDVNLDNVELLRIAKQSIKGMNIGPPMFLRIALHMTLQRDPILRAAHARQLPLYTRWNASNSSSLQAHLALHIEAPTPTYEVFRLDNGRDIPWAHQRQIFQSLEQTYNNNLAKERDRIIWQMALCYHIGFGTSRDDRKASDYAQMAKDQGLGVAKIFSGLLNPTDVPSDQGDTYISNILALFRPSTSGLPPFIEAFDHWGIPTDANHALAATEDGLYCLHWLWALQPRAIENIVDKLLCSADKSRLLGFVNLPILTSREPDCQWPLQFLGTPLAVAVSVNSLPAVKALLRLGASPFAPVYGETQFPPEDPRLEWTSFHIAARCHCASIMRHLIEKTHPRDQSCLSPLGCAMTFSTSLERLAMHGAKKTQQLEWTVQHIKSIQSLTMVTSNGMSPLMQAIDFQDHEVATALLLAQPNLATTPFCSPQDHRIFNYPIHFAIQIASQRDVQETLDVPNLIDSYTNELSNANAPSRDSVGRTPLHLAATGDFSFVATWILQKRPGLLYVEDEWGRPPLHYCASPEICGVLLNEGSNVDHADKLGMAALHRACLDGAPELVSALLKAKPNLTLNNNDYGTPLHCAVISGSVDIVVALLDAGALPDATDKIQNTPAHVAAKLDRHQIMRILKRNGAKMIQNKLGRDPIRIALDEGRLGSEGILRILQPDWGHRANQQILDFDPKAPRLAQTQRTRVAKGADFLWNKDHIMARTEGVSQQPRDDSEINQVINEETMVSINSTFSKLAVGTLSTRRMDSFVQSSLEFASGLLKVDRDEAIHVIAKTAHDFANSPSDSIVIVFAQTPILNVNSDPSKVRMIKIPYNLFDEEETEESFGGGEQAGKNPDGDEFNDGTTTGETASVNTAYTVIGRNDSAVADETASINTAATLVGCPCGNKQQQHWDLVNQMITHFSTLWLSIKLNTILWPQTDLLGSELRTRRLQELEILATSALDEFYSISEVRSMNEMHRQRSFYRESYHRFVPNCQRPSEKYEEWRTQSLMRPVSIRARRDKDDWNQVNEEREWRKSRKDHIEKTGQQGWSGEQYGSGSGSPERQSNPATLPMMPAPAAWDPVWSTPGLERGP